MEATTWRPATIENTGYVMTAGTSLLASTTERFGSDTIVPMLAARSSVGRLGLFVHLAADIGNLGSIHAWTLELFASRTIRLHPGMKIAQVSFWRPAGDIVVYQGYYATQNQATASYAPAEEL
jgi:dCTP deaminase